MFKHSETKLLQCNPSDAYNLIANVERYPNFIPWVSEVKVLNQYENNNKNKVVEYEICVDFKVRQEVFSTKDTFYPDSKIEIELIKGPFSHLYNVWEVKPMGGGNTLVSFYIEFDFKSKVLGMIFSKVFIQAQKNIMNAFEKELQKVKQ